MKTSLEGKKKGYNMYQNLRTSFTLNSHLTSISTRIHPVAAMARSTWQRGEDARNVARQRVARRCKEPLAAQCGTPRSLGKWMAMVYDL